MKISTEKWTVVNNLYYCTKCEIVQESKKQLNCPKCKEPMADIGFVEDADGREKKVKKLID